MQKPTHSNGNFVESRHATSCVNMLYKQINAGPPHPSSISTGGQNGVILLLLLEADWSVISGGCTMGACSTIRQCNGEFHHDVPTLFTVKVFRVFPHCISLTMSASDRNVAQVLYHSTHVGVIYLT